MKQKNGFTLVEILIVVGIIGLLASVVLSGLGSVRGRGRDARRVADLRQAQQGLELYYTKNQTYPETSDWNTLRQTLIGSGIGISSLASDPLCSDQAECSNISTNYNYATEDGQGYVLEAVLEDNSSSLLKESFHEDYQGTNCKENGHYCIKF